MRLRPTPYPNILHLFSVLPPLFRAATKVLFASSLVRKIAFGRVSFEQIVAPIIAILSCHRLAVGAAAAAVYLIGARSLRSLAAPWADVTPLRLVMPSQRVVTALICAGSALICTGYAP